MHVEYHVAMATGAHGADVAKQSVVELDKRLDREHQKGDNCNISLSNAQKLLICVKLSYLYYF